MAACAVAESGFHKTSETLCMQVKQMFAPLWNTVAKRYRAAVFSELSQVGLRYDDLYDPLKDEVHREKDLHGHGTNDMQSHSCLLFSCRMWLRPCAACPLTLLWLAMLACVAPLTWT